MLLVNALTACERAPTAAGPAQPLHPAAAAHDVIGGESNPFGVVAQGLGDLPQTGPMMLDALKDNEIGWIRLTLYWWAAQPNGPTDWDVAQVEAVKSVARWAHARGLHAYLSIDTQAPGWANGYQSPGRPPTSAHEADWQSYVTRVTQEFSAADVGVTHFSIGNEPEVEVQPLVGDWFPAYERLLSLGAGAIKAQSSAFKVIGFELGNGAIPFRLADVNAALGRLPNVDILAVHLYGPAMSIFTTANDTLPKYGVARETWVTEAGPNSEHYSAQYQRDNLALLYSKFAHDGTVPEPAKKTNWRWTKLFYYRLHNPDVTFSDDRVLFQGATTNDPAQLQARPALYAYQYLASTYSAASGRYSLRYAGYRNDGGPYSESQWATADDASQIGVSGQWYQYLSYRFQLHPAATAAGMRICYAVTFSWIFGTHSTCDGGHHGPFVQESQTKTVQQLGVWLENPLPSPNANDLGVGGGYGNGWPDNHAQWVSWSPMRACGRVSYANSGWLSGGQMRCDYSATNLSQKPDPNYWIEAISFNLDGDLR